MTIVEIFQELHEYGILNDRSSIKDPVKLAKIKELIEFLQSMFWF